MEQGYRGEEDTQGKSIVDRLISELEHVVAPRARAIGDETRRFLFLVAWLNTRLEGNGLGRIIVTGGFAVELYTGRVYRTMDVDIVVEGPRAIRVLEDFLARIASRIGRGYILDDAALALKSIDIVGTVYDRRAPPVTIKVDEYHVYVEPPEELIVRYLAAWKHWGSLSDRDKALWLYIVWRDRLDMSYLEARAREEQVEDKLEELREIAENQPGREENRFLPGRS